MRRALGATSAAISRAFLLDGLLLSVAGAGALGIAACASESCGGFARSCQARSPGPM